MVSFFTGLEDYAAKSIIDGVISGYIARGEIPAGDRPMFERVAIDVLNAGLTEFAKAKGIAPDAPA